VDLARLIGRQMPVGSRLLHLAGVQRTAGFEEDLLRRGFQVDVLELYSAEKISYPTDFLLRLLSGAPVWGAPVLSERAAVLLTALVGQDLLPQVFEETRFFCISEKVAQPLWLFAAGRIFVSDDPSAESVMALVSSHR